MAEINVNTQSSIIISGTKTLYFDPWKLADGAAKADVIFVTHNHFDHYSPDDIKKIMTDDTVIAAPESMMPDIVAKTGFSLKQCLPVCPGRAYTANGVDFKTVPAYNKLKPFHPKKDGWCGYVAELDGRRYYVMGDTDATSEALAVKCDVLLIPIGGTYTMNCRQAVEYACTVKPEVVIPTHYGDVVGDTSDGKYFAEMVNEKCQEINVQLKL